PAFAADCYHRNIFGFILFDESLRRFNDIGIESTGKAFIAADEDYQVILVAALIKQRMRKIFRYLCAQISKHLGHFGRKRTRSRYAIL
ncbi:hypothetical protein OFB80_30360, partial [Escherichia coli]|nr:hypothetical protein [Escherichia coli]